MIMSNSLHPFLNLKLWDFCFRSLIREYGLKFIFLVILRHPIKTLKGIIKYGGTSKHFEKTGDPWIGGEKHIVGIGFCLKPLDPVCISGRSNHNCHYLENNLHIKDVKIPQCCQHCTIKDIGLLTLATGSNFYIMTSARDILLDMYLPSIKNHTFTHGLFAICRFSFEPFKIPLCIADMQASIFPFETGDCRDYPTWLLADNGRKDEQTVINDNDSKTINAILAQSITEPSPHNSYKKVGNIYYKT
jgi:hypothetical protein